ncbi:ogr/Delta-like zinc finger family protein [Novosphingobium sp.]|uniref:ogr/Delta-like zinc finger family protein n=1 Tax=Novosphingobium sp. TaxID=1874826 RepID=UPI002FDC9F17
MASAPVPFPDFDDKIERAGRLRCPHCNSVARCRTSRLIMPTHRDIYYRCINLFCGHTWKAVESYEYGIVPSAIPNPRVTLPLRTVTRQDAMEIMRPRDAAQPELFDGASPPELPG